MKLQLKREKAGLYTTAVNGVQIRLRQRHGSNQGLWEVLALLGTSGRFEWIGDGETKKDAMGRLQAWADRTQKVEESK